MTRNTYLAEKYMSGPKADAILARMSHKAKKRKVQQNPTSTVSYKLIEDDDGVWMKEDGEDVDNIEEAVVTTDGSFKKKLTSWATINEGETQQEGPPAVGYAKLQNSGDSLVTETAFVAGLVTADQLKKALARKEGQNVVTEGECNTTRIAQETIYRDAFGRKIDMKAERVKAARGKRETEEREVKKRQWGKGLVQREDEERQRAQLAQECNRALVVYADGKDLNEAQKAKSRWNDPAVVFLTVRTILFSPSAPAKVTHSSILHIEKALERAEKTRVHRTNITS